MKKYGRIIVMLLVVVFMISIPVISWAKAEIVLRFAHIMPAENSQGLAVQFFADLVEKKTDGKVKVNVFPACQLGSSEEQFEMTRLGTCDFTMASLDYYAPIEETWKVCGWAFAFKSNEHLINYTKSDAYEKAIGRIERDYKLKVIAVNWIRGPFKVLVSKKPIMTLDDFQGIKLRMPEVEAQLKNWSAIGAIPTPIAWPELLLALTQGIVEACDSPFDLVYDMKFHTAAPYVLLSKHMYQPIAVSMSAISFHKLDKEYQNAILEAAKEAGDWYTEQSFAGFEENKKKLIAEGAVIIEANMSEWRKNSMEAAWEMEKNGEWPAGTIQEVLLDTEPK